MRISTPINWRGRGVIDLCPHGEEARSAVSNHEAPDRAALALRDARHSASIRALTPVFDGLWGEGTRCASAVRCTKAK